MPAPACQPRGGLLCWCTSSPITSGRTQVTSEPVTSPPEKSMKDLDRAATRTMLHSQRMWISGFQQGNKGGLRIFAKVEYGHSVLDCLMVAFESHTKVNHKILGCHSAHSLCLKNRQIGTSALEIGIFASQEELSTDLSTENVERPVPQNTKEDVLLTCRDHTF